jgi:hypothetical protein
VVAVEDWVTSMATGLIGAGEATALCLGGGALGGCLMLIPAIVLSQDIGSQILIRANPNGFRIIISLAHNVYLEGRG